MQTQQMTGSMELNSKRFHCIISNGCAWKQSRTDSSMFAHCMWAMHRCVFHAFFYRSILRALVRRAAFDKTHQNDKLNTNANCLSPPEVIVQSNSGHNDNIDDNFDSLNQFLIYFSLWNILTNSQINAYRLLDCFHSNENICDIYTNW